MYLVNESSLLEPVKRVYKTREKSQSLLDHPRILISSCCNFQYVHNNSIPKKKKKKKKKKKAEFFQLWQLPFSSYMAQIPHSK